MDKNRFNSLKTGMITGILLPLICFVLVIFIRKGSYSFTGYLKEIEALGAVPKLFSLCLLPNLLLFFIFIWSDMIRGARGVLFSMFFAGAVIIITKLI